MFQLTNSNYKFSLYKNLFSVNKPEFDIDINQLIEIVKYGYLKKEIGAIRNANTKEEYSSLKKSSLPTVTLSGVFGYRNKESLIKHSGLIQVDIDKIENINKYNSLFSKIIEDDYTYVAFKSPGGKGIKVIMKINPSSKTHLSQFYALETYYKEVFDIEIDLSCKDLSRTMLLSYDPELYCNPYSDTFELLEDRSTKKRADKKRNFQKFEYSKFNKKTFLKEDEEVVKYLADELTRNKVDITATYENWIKVGFSIGNTLGENGRNYFHQISAVYPEYNFEETNKLYTNLLAKNSGGITIASLIYLAKESGIGISSHDYEEKSDDIYEELRKLRLEIARNEDKPAFAIFSNKVLNQFVKIKPKSKSDLLKIKGIGNKKIKDYGTDFLNVIKKFN